MTDVAIHSTDTDLGVQMRYAQAITGGPRGQSILPESYRDNPANALIAIGLGQAMGLTPAESLYRIAVIKGKPSASAELIAANVRKAGHKLRVRVQENPPKASATIIRADDPDEPVTIERDMDWAARMGLDKEPNYRKQPATMLSYRAITACARLACPEALYGVSYTPEEAREVPEEPVTAAPRVTAATFLDTPGEVVFDAPDDEPEQPETDLASDAQHRMMRALVARVPELRGDDDKPDRDKILAFARDAVGAPDLESSKDLTKAQMSKLIDALNDEVNA